LRRFVDGADQTNDQERQGEDEQRDQAAPPRSSPPASAPVADAGAWASVAALQI